MPRTFLACLICLIPAVALAQADKGEDLDQVLSNWEGTQQGIKSLVVEFTRTFEDSVFHKKEKTNGTIRLVRTPDGHVRASLELTPVNPSDPKLKAGLLDNRTIYLVVGESKKTELRLSLGDKDMVEFLADDFNPLTLLLDRKRAEQNTDLEVQRDANYTYLLMKTKKPKSWSARFPSGFQMARVTLTNFPTKDVPRGMPTQLWYQTTFADTFLFEIRSWRMNSANGPTVEDLDREVNLPGWTIVEYDLPLTWRKLFGGQQNVRKINP